MYVFQSILSIILFYSIEDSYLCRSNPIYSYVFRSIAISSDLSSDEPVHIFLSICPIECIPANLFYLIDLSTFAHDICGYVYEYVQIDRYLDQYRHCTPRGGSFLEQCESTFQDTPIWRLVITTGVLSPVTWDCHGPV